MKCRKCGHDCLGGHCDHCFLRREGADAERARIDTVSSDRWGTLAWKVLDDVADDIEKNEP